MLRVGDLLVRCGNLCAADRVKIVGNNDKLIDKNVEECLEESEIMNLNVNYFYVFDDIDIGCVISVKEDL